MFLTHISVKLYKIHEYFLKLLTLSTLFFLTTFLVQLNFEILSHNFGLKFFYFFNDNGVKLLFIILTLFLIKVKSYKFFQKNSNLNFLKKISSPNKTKRELKKIYYLSFIAIFIALFPIFISFSQLFNYSLWKFFNLNFNLWAWVNPLTILKFMYIFLLISWFFTKTQPFILTINSLFFPVYTFLGYFIFPKKKHQILHFFLGGLWVTNQLALTKDFFNWSLFVEPNQLLWSNNFLKNELILYTINGTLILKTFFWKENFTNLSLNYEINFPYFDSSVKQSLLIGGHSMLRNIQNSLETRFYVLLTTDLHNIQPLFFLTLYTLVFLLKNLSFKNLKQSYYFLP